jgi:hypothetical protein
MNTQEVMNMAVDQSLEILKLKDRVRALEDDLEKAILEFGDSIEVCVPLSFDHVRQRTYCGTERGSYCGCCGEMDFEEEYYINGIDRVVRKSLDGDIRLEDI